MTALAIYSTDYDPEPLYQMSEYDRAVDEQIQQFVRTGDRPLDLLVDLGSRRILWLFKAQRKTTTTRTGYYLADYHGTWDDDLFRGFEEAMRSLHDSDEWELPYQDEAQWDAGFNLWRAESEYPDLGSDAVSELHNGFNTSRPGDSPLVFGMENHHSAQQAITALNDDNLEVTVAIGGNGAHKDHYAVDLLLETEHAINFEPVSTAATAISDVRTDSDQSTPTTDTDRFEQPSIGSRIGGALLLVILGLSAYSFVSPQPVHPISGLAAIGGFLGTTLGYAVFVSTATHDSGVREHLITNLDQSIVVISYGTTIAFAYPTIFRIGGQLLTREMWLFGPVVTPLNALLSISVLLPVVFAVSYGLLRMFSEGLGGQPLESQVKQLVLAHVVYGLCLVLLTGFARDV